MQTIIYVVAYIFGIFDVTHFCKQLCMSGRREREREREIERERENVVGLNTGKKCCNARAFGNACNI